jgi:hypothetical protein
MANNYAQFSEYIEDLTPAACEWVETVLGFDLDDQDDPDEGLAKLKTLLSLEGDGVNLEYWPNFCWKIEGSGVGPDVKHSLWLYCEEGYDGEQLAVFVRELICRFMPDYIFTMTVAETCSKPRVGEFGGGWMVISKDEVMGGNTWDEAEKHAEALRTGNIGPEVDDEDAKPTAPKKKGRVRPIEMYCCYDDHTWQCEHFVEVPVSLPEQFIEEFALKQARKQFTDDSIMFIGLYSIPEDWSDWPQEGEE